MRLEEATGRLSRLDSSAETGTAGTSPSIRAGESSTGSLRISAPPPSSSTPMEVCAKIAGGGLDEGGRAAAVAARGKIFITSESGDLASFVVDGEASRLRLRTWMRRRFPERLTPRHRVVGLRASRRERDAIRTYSTSESGELTLVETSVGSFGSMALPSVGRLPLCLRQRSAPDLRGVARGPPHDVRRAAPSQPGDSSSPRRRHRACEQP